MKTIKFGEHVGFQHEKLRTNNGKIGNTIRLQNRDFTMEGIGP